MDFKIALVKPVEFETSKLDPFGFDEYAEKAGGEFMPFATTARKPAYYFFIDYTNWLLEEKLVEVKKPVEYRLRMEKLLVRSWMYGMDRDALRARSIIGVSTRRINPFKGNDGNWVVNTCFRLYGNSVTQIMQYVPEFSLQKQEREIGLLREFLAIEGPLDKRNEAKLLKLLDQLKQLKSRCFRSGGELILSDRRLFLSALKSSIRDKNSDSETGKVFWSLIRPYFDKGRHLNRERLQATVLGNQQLPFYWANQYMAALVRAVDSDLDGKPSRAKWDAFERSRKELKARFPMEERKLSGKITHPSCWIVYDSATGRYRKGADFDENKWNGHVNNAGNSESRYHAFRTGTLAQLIIESGL